METLDCPIKPGNDGSGEQYLGLVIQSVAGPRARPAVHLSQTVAGPDAHMANRATP
jgi:hypothetical protein